jgi:hypothetical protein
VWRERHATLLLRRHTLPTTTLPASLNPGLGTSAAYGRLCVRPSPAARARLRGMRHGPPHATASPAPSSALLTPPIYPPDSWTCLWLASRSPWRRWPLTRCGFQPTAMRGAGGGALRGAVDGAWHLDRATDHFLAYWAAVGPRRRACGRRGARAHRSRAIARWPRDARAPSRLQIRRRGAPLAMFARRA